MTPKKLVIGKYYNGFKTEIYDVISFDTIKNLPFYYDKATIYFSVIEDNKILQTVFLKHVLPPDAFYSLINIKNPNPLSMSPISFNLEDLPKEIHAIDVMDFDPAYYYDIEIRTTSYYQKIEKDFLKYIEEMLPRLSNNLDFKEHINILNANPFVFSKYNKQSRDSILSFLAGFEYKNPTLKHFISIYREYILFNIIISDLNKEETSSRIK